MRVLLERGQKFTLKDRRSSAHKRAFVTALQEAVRGVLYISANSPKDSPGPKDLTCAKTRIDQKMRSQGNVYDQAGIDT